MSNLLPRNEHNIERILRILVGAVVLSLVFIGPKTMWGLIGIIPLATGFIGSCPAYSIFGVSTCSAPKSKTKQVT